MGFPGLTNPMPSSYGFSLHALFMAAVPVAYLSHSVTARLVFHTGFGDANEPDLCNGEGTFFHIRFLVLSFVLC